MPSTRNLQSQLLYYTVPRRRLIPLKPNYSFPRSVSTTVSSTALQQQSRWPRRLRTLLYIGIFGGLGLYYGKFLHYLLEEPPLPDTDKDIKTMEAIRSVYSRLLPIVRELRNDPDYEEWEAYDNFSDEEKEHRLTSGTLKGSRGLAVQRIFYNDKEKKVVNVVYFGSGLEGWPSVVHGGALATVLDETMGRVAIRSFPARTGVTANLDINYRSRVRPDDTFYIVHACLDQERSTDRKAYVNAEIRHINGRLCVEATALFVVPKNLTLRQIGDEF